MAYLPVYFENGKVLLVQGGDVAHIFDPAEARLRVFEFPEDVCIPIERLVVVVKEDGSYELDAQSRQRYDEAGNRRKNVKRKSIEYYRWDGAQLVLEMKEKLK